MRASQLRRFLRKGRKMKCAKCPIPRGTCNSIAKGLWGEEKCLLRVMLREVLIFYTEEHERRPSPQVKGPKASELRR